MGNIGPFCVRVSSILLKIMIFQENRGAATTGKTIGCLTNGLRDKLPVVKRPKARQTTRDQRDKLPVTDRVIPRLARPSAQSATNYP